MLITREDLKAYLIIDNCFLVMLTDCFCERFASRYPQNRVIDCAESWISEILNILKRFAVNGNLHCTDGVAREYQPHVGSMVARPGIQHINLKHLQRHICANLTVSPANIPCSQDLRMLPAAPKKLVGAGGLSDNDLSLVWLGLELTQTGLPVYLLTNDQSLLDFVTWVKTKKNCFNAPIMADLLQGWRSLTYLELIHRSCNISSDIMKDLIEFALVDHYNRVDIARSQKGNSIFQQLMGVYGNFNQSVVIKQERKAAAA